MNLTHSMNCKESAEPQIGDTKHTKQYEFRFIEVIHFPTVAVILRARYHFSRKQKAFYLSLDFRGFLSPLHFCRIQPRSAILILVRYHGLCCICCLRSLYSVWNRSVKLASCTKVASVQLIRGLVAILDRSKLKLTIFKLHRTVEFIHLWSIQLDISWYMKSLRIDTKRSMLTDSTSTMMCFDNSLLWKQKNAFKQIWVYVTRELGR